MQNIFVEHIPSTIQLKLFSNEDLDLFIPQGCWILISDWC